tara:strand:+ start:129 stop:365 length:237 start_codon:yes stop_codon:yes gene_type:complete
MISSSAGNFYYTKGLEASKTGSMGEALSLLKAAKAQYSDSLKSDPTNPHILTSYAQCCAVTLELEKRYFSFPLQRIFA